MLNARDIRWTESCLLHICLLQTCAKFVRLMSVRSCQIDAKSSAHQYLDCLLNASQIGISCLSALVVSLIWMYIDSTPAWVQLVRARAAWEKSKKGYQRTESCWIILAILLPPLFPPVIWLTSSPSTPIRLTPSPLWHLLPQFSPEGSEKAEIIQFRDLEGKVDLRDSNKTVVAKSSCQSAQEVLCIVPLWSVPQDGLSHGLVACWNGNLQSHSVCMPVHLHEPSSPDNSNVIISLFLYLATDNEGKVKGTVCVWKYVQHFQCGFLLQMFFCRMIHRWYIFAHKNGFF